MHCGVLRNSSASSLQLLRSTTTLALGSRQLSAQGAIVARLTAIEEMAGMTVLCSDKTGTLTLNQMVIQATLNTLNPVPGQGPALQATGLDCLPEQWCLRHTGVQPIHPHTVSTSVGLFALVCGLSSCYLCAPPFAGPCFSTIEDRRVSKWAHALIQEPHQRAARGSCVMRVVRAEMRPARQHGAWHRRLEF